ncbi:hypothetical protein PEGLEG_141 [Mycobacterium phage PegLeg]|uniref:Uncharacterized protein n=1 Tax=Mycobacterium phage PegLeg TaxID=1325953 RepID=R4T926_9CAUD|nr:hypothetical protein PEGLEG_141 [Mycobacterium phage PegLeg]AGM12369.1 hypothetical protein PEGLEG_141 [Mycobacterium phage PegLeg]
MSSRICYYANESFYDHAKGDYVVAVVTEDEAGYNTLSTVYGSAERAKAAADALNQDLGLSRDDVLDIVASSMRAGRAQR